MYYNSHPSTPVVPPQCQCPTQKCSGMPAIIHRVTSKFVCMFYRRSDLPCAASISLPQNTWGSSKSEQYWICGFSKVFTHPSILSGISHASFSVWNPFFYLFILPGSTKNAFFVKLFWCPLEELNTFYLLFLLHWSQISILALIL